MKDLNDVYKKLKRQYKKLSISIDENKITINLDGDYKIEATDKLVELSKGLTYVNHKISNNYDEVFKTIKMYISNPQDSIYSIRKQRLISFIIALILTLIIGLLLDIFNI